MHFGDTSYYDMITRFMSYCSAWESVFNLIPRRCEITNKLLWLRHSYRGTRFVGGGEYRFSEHFYVDRDAFTMWQLTRDHNE